MTGSLPIAQELALAHAGTAVRSLLATFFDLDSRLAQFVSQSKEPILTQMRIAWWRDQFAKPPEDRPTGDPVLDALTKAWIGEEPALIALVDGWEGLLAEPPLPEDAATQFAAGRGACFAAIARLAGKGGFADRADQAGRYWAMADLAARLSTEEERDFVIELAQAKDVSKGGLPYRLRAFSILEKLSANVIDCGANSMMTGRRDLLAVMRLGLFGK